MASRPKRVNVTKSRSGSRRQHNPRVSLGLLWHGIIPSVGTCTAFLSMKADTKFFILLQKTHWVVSLGILWRRVGSGPMWSVYIQSFQKDKDKSSVQTRATIHDKAADFWKAMVLEDSRANLQVAVGLWHCTDSNVHLFSYPNSSEAGMPRVFTHPLQPLPLGSSHMEAVTCTCSNIKSSSIKACRVAADNGGAPDLGKVRGR